MHGSEHATLRKLCLTGVPSQFAPQLEMATGCLVICLREVKLGEAMLVRNEERKLFDHMTGVCVREASNFTINEQHLQPVQKLLHPLHNQSRIHILGIEEQVQLVDFGCGVSQKAQEQNPSGRQILQPLPCPLAGLIPESCNPLHSGDDGLDVDDDSAQRRGKTAESMLGSAKRLAPLLVLVRRRLHSRPEPLLMGLRTKDLLRYRRLASDRALHQLVDSVKPGPGVL